MATALAPGNPVRSNNPISSAVCKISGPFWISRSRGRSDDGTALRLTDRTTGEVGDTEGDDEGLAKAVSGGGIRMAGKATGLG